MNQPNPHAHLRAAFTAGCRIQAWHLNDGATNSNDGRWDTLTPKEGAEPEFGCEAHLYRVHPEDISLIAELGQEVGAVGDGTCYDRGPWRWERTGSKVDVFSDDFTCDVALRIDGDFATDDVADSYAKWLADTLNGHITSPAHTSEARDAARYRWLRNRAINFGLDDESGTPYCVYGIGCGDANPTDGEELDNMIDHCAEIDAAMRQEAGDA